MPEPPPSPADPDPDPRASADRNPILTPTPTPTHTPAPIPNPTLAANDRPGGVAALPDYLPARMVNEFVYCPRLFYYEWVEGLFAHNRETVEGALRHSKLDSAQDALSPADELAPEDRVHARSVTLSSDAHKLIAKIDLVEAEGTAVTAVDYKRGSPRKRSMVAPRSAKGCFPDDDERSSPHKPNPSNVEPWPADRVQVAAQALVLRDNGYSCQEAVIYYVKTKQRVRVTIDDTLIAETLGAVAAARATAAAGEIPPPLVDSPKCPRCSLVGICLPDETRLLHAVSDQASAARDESNLAPALQTATNNEQLTTDNRQLTNAAEPRRLVAARDDLMPLYLNAQGLTVGKSGNVLKVKEADAVVQEVRIGETCQVNVFGNIQLTTQAIQTLCQNEVPIAYFSQGGWFYGMTNGLGVRNIALRREQFRLAEDPEFCLSISRSLVAGKIRNQRTMLMRNHAEPPAGAIAQLKCLCDDAENAEYTASLLGIEGNAARIYFENFSGMIKAASAKSRLEALAEQLFGQFADEEDCDGALAEGDIVAFRSAKVLGAPGESGSAGPKVFPTKPASGQGEPQFNFDFTHRNRRPPRDPVNALLSLAYSVLAKDLTIVCHAVGFDPFIGLYHQPRFGRAPLPLDLMEPFRPLIADSAVLSAINTRMITPSDFIRAGQSVALRPEGRKAFFRAYEQRMDTLVTHPIFGYRLNYRRMLEIQTRLLARVVTGEIASYPVFVTR